MGRPSLYTPEIAEEICERIASGETLTAICLEEGMPALRTVMKWLSREDFGPLYARAKELRLEVMAEEIKQLSDECREGSKIKTGPLGVEITTGDMVERSRLQIDSRKWLLARLASKTYGDRTALEHSGPGGTELVVTLRSVLDDPK